MSEEYVRNSASRFVTHRVLSAGLKHQGQMGWPKHPEWRVH